MLAICEYICLFDLHKIKTIHHPALFDFFYSVTVEAVNSSEIKKC